jgi:predicted DNA-binding protein
MATFPVPERVPLPFNVRLSQELIDDISELADRHKTTKSRIVRGLLQQSLEQIKDGSVSGRSRDREQVDG